LGGVVGSYIFGGREEAFVASGSEDGDVVVWDVTSKDVLWRERGHKDVVLGMDFGRTKGGKGMGLLVSGGRDRDVRVWSLEGEERGLEDDMHMHMEMGMDMEGLGAARQQQRERGQGADAHVGVGEEDILRNLDEDVDELLRQEGGVGGGISVGRTGVGI